MIYLYFLKALPLHFNSSPIYLPNVENCVRKFKIVENHFDFVENLADFDFSGFKSV